MHWFFIIFAGIMETGWVFSLKNIQGFSKLWPWAGYISFGLACALSLSQGLKSIPMAVAYSAWMAVAVMGTFAIDVIRYHEPLNVIRIGSIVLILIGIAGLRISTL